MSAKGLPQDVYFLITTSFLLVVLANTETDKVWAGVLRACGFVGGVAGFVFNFFRRDE